MLEGRLGSSAGGRCQCGPKGSHSEVERALGVALRRRARNVARRAMLSVLIEQGSGERSMGRSGAVKPNRSKALSVLGNRGQRFMRSRLQPAL